MKRGLTLLLVSLLAALGLTACGGSNTKQETTTQPDSAVVDGETAETPDAAGDDQADEAVTDKDHTGDTLLDDAQNGVDDVIDGTEDVLDDVTDSARSGGATYEQMVRNGRVHDTDGDLTDMENSAIPGSTF